MITSKVTSKAQTTIPQTIRDILGIFPGDQLEYKIEGNRVILTRATPEADELSALTALLSEWSAPENDVYDCL